MLPKQNSVILTVVPNIFHNPVKDNQQMLKGVVRNFIVLIKLPRHVSASKCHPQGLTCSS